MAALVPRSRLVLQSEETSPLGQVSLAGYLRDSKGIPPHRPRVYGHYALVYLLEGSGRVGWAQRPAVPCRAGDLFLSTRIFRNGMARDRAKKWSEFYIVFSGPVFDFWRREGLLEPPFLIRHLPRLRRWLPRLEAVTGPSLPPTTQGMLRRVCRLQEFLAEIVEGRPREAEAVPWLDRARHQLVDAPEIRPAALARSLGLSYETFRKEFARQTGLPPGRYRLHRLIEQARILITERGLNNKQLAETLGFYDEFHFSRRFRQITGQSPRQFRLALRRTAGAAAGDVRSGRRKHPQRA